MKRRKGQLQASVRGRSLAQYRALFSDTSERKGPMPLQSVLRIIEEHAEVVRGDGSRRRCEELRRGLKRYRAFTKDGLVVEPFALFLWLNCAASEYPVFDWADIDVERLAYVPPPQVLERKPREVANSGFRFTLPYDPRISMRKRKRLHNGSVNRAVKRRLRQGTRPQRILVGERAVNVALRDEDVLAIRIAYLDNEISLKKLGERYGVSGGTIGQIVSGATWKHLPLDPREVQRDWIAKPDESVMGANLHFRRKRIFQDVGKRLGRKMNHFAVG